MTETQFQRVVTDLCDWLRLPWYHTHDSRRSPAGFPDLVIVGSNTVLFAELKSASGRVTPAQQEWYRHLFEAGQHVYVWRPADIRDIKVTLEKLAKGTL